MPKLLLPEQSVYYYRLQGNRIVLCRFGTRMPLYAAVMQNDTDKPLNITLADGSHTYIHFRSLRQIGGLRQVEIINRFTFKNNRIMKKKYKSLVLLLQVC